MSFIDSLFPRKELETLRSKRPKLANKRRRLNSDLGNRRHYASSLVPRQQNSRSALNRRPHLVGPLPPQHRGPPASTATLVSAPRRACSESIKARPLTVRTSKSTAKPALPKSYFPSFIEPSLLKNYLRHLHRNDRSQYCGPRSPKFSTQPAREKPQQTSQQSHEDVASSPGSCTTDNLTEGYPTPPARSYQQLRPGRFEHLLNGVRLTKHERDIIFNLLNSEASLSITHYIPSVKRKASQSRRAIALENFSKLDQGFLHEIKDTSIRSPSDGRDKASADEDIDLHSSGLSSTKEAEDEGDEYISPPEIVMYDYSFICVDDFFDLDKASA
ncbi:hypothetical protein GQ44DRAFT_591892, partial [Phaeosphaeriaceae sp. PMI808]